MAQDALSVARAAAQGFGLLKCEECAQAIQAALIAEGHHGEWIELGCDITRPYMMCLSYQGGTQTITQNARHVGVRVHGMVFDNIHPDGMPEATWLVDFDAYGGVRVVSVTRF